MLVKIHAESLCNQGSLDKPNRLVKIIFIISTKYIKAPITTAADDIYKYFFIVFSEKIRLDISCESSARQRIHMKNQALFSLKDKR